MKAPTKDQLQSSESWPDGATHYSPALNRFLQRDFGDWLVCPASRNEKPKNNFWVQEVAQEEWFHGHLIERPKGAA